MKLPLQKFLSSKWQSGITFAVLFLLLTVGSVLAEPPTVQLRPLAPGWIAIDWQHPLDNAVGVSLEREDPPYTWVSLGLNNTYIDMDLQPSHVYQYRACAYYGTTPDCSEWSTAQTLALAPPPPPGNPVPSFTSPSATPTSITVNWTSSASYDFYQIRYARNGQPDGQDPKHWRCCSYTANGLSPGTYHFIVQGCNDAYFGLSTSCSNFSAPIEVATSAPPPPPPARGVIYGITDNGGLMWYRHDGESDGTFKWAPNNGAEVGTGWGDVKHVFSGGDGIIYVVTPIVEATLPTGTGPGMGGHPASGGELKWFRHVGREDGSFRWEGPKKVGTGWGDVKHVFSGGDGIIYVVTPIVEATLPTGTGPGMGGHPASGGDLMWFRHVGREDGSFRWEGPKKVGTGWNFKQIFHD